jgi:hypothetical protein
MIAKYTTNLYASEVYRELERNAVKKGFFKPTEEQIVKSAADKISKKSSIDNSAVPSDNIDLDIARLATAMRRKGFLAQADSLEEKFALYKQAESSLYNVTPDSNQDIVDFAHKDGDVQIIEGAGEYGKVETIKSMSDKIKAMISKEPTGRYPNKTAKFARMVREAQITDEFGVGGGESFRERNLNDLKKIFSTVNSKFASYPNLSEIASKASFNIGAGGPMDILNNEAARNLYSSISKENPSEVLEMFRYLSSIGIQGRPKSGSSADSARPYYAVLENYKESPQNAQKLAKNVNLNTNRTSGVAAIILNRRDVTNEVQGYNFSGVEKPYINPNSYINLEITGRKDDSNKTIHAQASFTSLNQKNAQAFANELRHSVYTKSDSVFGENFSKLTEVNEKISGEINTFGGISNWKIQITPNAVAENGDITHDALAPMGEAQKKYDEITRNLENGFRVINLLSPELANNMKEWQADFKKLIIKAADDVMALQGHGSEDITDNLGSLGLLIDLWNKVLDEYRKKRASNSKEAITSKQNVNEIKKFKDSLYNAGLPGNIKPSQSFNVWLKQNNFESVNDLTNWINENLRFAQSQLDIAQAAPEGRRI